jgi:hypothetical protein
MEPARLCLGFVGSAQEAGSAEFEARDALQQILTRAPRRVDHADCRDAQKGPSGTLLTEIAFPAFTPRRPFLDSALGLDVRIALTTELHCSIPGRGAPVERRAAGGWSPIETAARHSG